MHNFFCNNLNFHDEMLSLITAYHHLDNMDDEDDEDTALLASILCRRNEESTLLEITTAYLEAVRERTGAVRMKNAIENSRLYSDITFVVHYRLSRPAAYLLIDSFAHSDVYRHIERSAGRKCMSAEQHILVFLYFAGHETICYRAVADRFDITLNSLFNIITRVTNFLLALAPDVIRMPNNDEKKSMERHFRVVKQFPGVVGALDGSHITIDRPSEDPTSYINRKKDYSIHMQALVDHKAQFRHVWIGYPGSVHDARVFHESNLPEELDQRCGDGEYVLGDSAYPLRRNLLVPYRNNGHLTAGQQRFNTRLSKSRVIVEHTFGRLKQRFRQLYHCKLSVVRCVRFIHACCVLHNVINGDNEGLKILDQLRSTGLETTPPECVENPPLNTVQQTVLQGNQAAGIALREELTRQFLRTGPSRRRRPTRV